MPLQAIRSRALVPVSAATLVGDLIRPATARALVLVVQAGGIGPLGPRVTTSLTDAGLATLLVDLLTETEAIVDARTGHLRFDIPLLAARVAAATDWIRAQPATSGLRLGYFGAGTAATAALTAAAARPDAASALVSLASGLDLAAHVLPQVQAPTLLIVGGNDPPVLARNREALARLPAGRLELVPAAGHLFEEPAALERIVDLARRWFERHLTHPPEA